MLNIIASWFMGLWASMEIDITFAAIGGIIIIAAQLVNAGIGIWKNVGKESREFDWKFFLQSFVKEVGLTLLVMAGIAVAYALGGLVELTLIPGFEMGDLPSVAIIAAYGAIVLEKAKNVFNNLIVIMNGEED